MEKIKREFWCDICEKQISTSVGEIVFHEKRLYYEDVRIGTIGRCTIHYCEECERILLGNDYRDKFAEIQRNTFLKFFQKKLKEHNDATREKNQS